MIFLQCLSEKSRRSEGQKLRAQENDFFVKIFQIFLKRGFTDFVENAIL